LDAGIRLPYSMAMVEVENHQSYAIPLAANDCSQPYSIWLEMEKVQPWRVPVVQTNTQRIRVFASLADAKISLD